MTEQSGMMYEGYSGVPTEQSKQGTQRQKSISSAFQRTEKSQHA